MKHITILVPNGENNLSSIVGAYKILTRANRYAKEKGNKTLYKIELAGVSKKINFHDGLFSVKPHTHISAVSKTHLIIIPSLNHNFQQSTQANKVLIKWITDQYKNGAEVASICTGAFLLAATGLLNGHSCSTHWAFAQALQDLFPEIRVLPDQTITHEKGIYTNGGAFSYLNLMLYLVEKYFDRATAILCSKVFQIEMDRHSQSPFAIFAGQKSHSDEAIVKAQNFLEKNYNQKISIPLLASEFSIGRRSFDRRFIKATGNTPLEYQQRLRIEAAKKALESSRKTINEVMYDCGYTDVKAFREVFRKIAGMLPLDYKKRYNKDAANS